MIWKVGLNENTFSTVEVPQPNNKTLDYIQKKKKDFRYLSFCKMVYDTD